MLKSTEAPCNFSLRSLFTSRVNSRFTVTVALRPFFTTCWAILLALMGTWGLLFFSPVNRRTTLQAFRLEWVKSIACTVSTHLSWRADVPSVLLPCHVFLVQLWRNGVSLTGHNIRCPIRGYISFGGLLVCAVWQF